jgi:hypothetical protein
MKKIDWLGLIIILLFIHIGALSVMLVATFIEALKL